MGNMLLRVRAAHRGRSSWVTISSGRSRCLCSWPTPEGRRRARLSASGWSLCTPQCPALHVLAPRPTCG